jgi:hypothetical protein
MVGRWKKGEGKRNEVTLETHDKVRISLVPELTRAFIGIDRAASSSHLLGGTRAGASPTWPAYDHRSFHA